MILQGTPSQKTGKVLIVNPDPEITHILEVNLAHANMATVTAQNGSEALSMIWTDKPDIIIFDAALTDMEWSEVYRYIQKAPGDVPVILIGSKAKKRDISAKAEEIAVGYISKPFEPKEVVALVRGYLRHKERVVNIDPLTGLPNWFQVNKEIAKLIGEEATFAFIYIATHDLKAINRAYGYTQGDWVIQLMSEIVSEAVRVFGNPEDLAGHLGGDKFVIISTPWKARTLCRRIIADYSRRIKSLFTEEHLQIGHAALKASSDREESPVMSVHVAVVTNEKRTFSHHLEVIESATQQMEYLRSLPDSNCYFDLNVDGVEPPSDVSRWGVVKASKEELRVMQGALAWLDFLHGELESPMNEMRENIRSLESINEENLSREQRSVLKSLRENFSYLTRVVQGVTGFIKPEGLRSCSFFNEVDIRNVLSWVLEQVQPLAETKGVTVDIKPDRDLGCILIDQRSLSQSLLNIVRSEIRASAPESRLLIRLAEKNEEYIKVEIINPDRFLSPKTLNSILQGQTCTAEVGILKNEIYPAGILLRELGGKLEVTSEKKKGTTYQIVLPKKWQSWMIEVNALQMAMDISRREARDAIRSVQNLVASIVGPVPAELKDAYERLVSKIQELAVLCSRSMFLADDFLSRLEAQQDRLLQQESEHAATSEAIVTICRDMLRSMQIKPLFSPVSVRRVVKYTMAIAKELKMSDTEQQALYYAAQLKDVALAFSPAEVVINMGLSSGERMVEVKKSLNLVWKALSRIPFFSPACKLLLYRFERYDGSGGYFGIKGDDIPLGSRILAVADRFDFWISKRSHQGKLELKLAVEKIVADSGICHDPHVVDAFLMLWKRKELDAILSESC